MLSPAQKLFRQYRRDRVRYAADASNWLRGTEGREDAGFLAKIKEGHDPAVHSVYADWLDEQGRVDESVAHRWIAATDAKTMRGLRELGIRHVIQLPAYPPNVRKIPGLAGHDDADLGKFYIPWPVGELLVKSVQANSKRYHPDLSPRFNTAQEAYAALGRALLDTGTVKYSRRDVVRYAAHDHDAGFLAKIDEGLEQAQKLSRTGRHTKYSVGDQYNPEQGFIDYLEKNPHDTAGRSAYSDWLEEQGRTDEAEAHRWIVENKKRPQHNEALNSYYWFSPEAAGVGTHEQFEHGIPREVLRVTPETHPVSFRYRDFHSAFAAYQALVAALVAHRQSTQNKSN